MVSQEFTFVGQPESRHRKFLVAVDEPCFAQVVDIVEVSRFPVPIRPVEAKHLVTIKITMGSEQSSVRHGRQNRLFGTGQAHASTQPNW